MSFLQSLLGGGSNELIGLDISSSAVKLIELARRGERYSVEAYAVEPLPANVVNEKQITDPKSVGEAIARAIARAGTRTRNAAIAVAGASVITKTITMSASLKEADMEEQIKAEADQYIPYSLDDVNLDFQVIGVSPKNPANVDVQLAACRKELIEQRVAALEIAGLVAKVIDIESYALENACPLLYHQMPDLGRHKTIALFDIGASMTSLLVLHDRNPVYTREQAFGGRQLTDDIMRFYNMSYADAGRGKRMGGLPENYETEVLAGFISDLTLQIDRALQFFFSAATQHRNIDALVLAGGCAHIPGIDVAVQDRLKLQTSVARPFAQMGVAARAKPAQLARDEASLLIAAGLALRAFDEVEA
jgi:type IV pilus assembly protein PilM